MCIWAGMRQKLRSKLSHLPVTTKVLRHFLLHLAPNVKGKGQRGPEQKKIRVVAIAVFVHGKAGNVLDVSGSDWGRCFPGTKLVSWLAMISC